MPLTTLACTATQVSDLTPLKGMPLTSLSCGDTKVSNLSPLKGMRLGMLDCHQTQVSDLTPLKGMPIEATELPANKGDRPNAAKRYATEDVKCRFQAKAGRRNSPLDQDVRISQR